MNFKLFKCDCDCNLRVISGLNLQAHHQFLGQWVAWIRISPLSWTTNLDVKNCEQVDSRLEIRNKVKGSLCF